MFPVINRMRDLLLESEKDIGVLVDTSLFEKIEKEYSSEEVAYALRYLDGKDFFKRRSDGSGYVITSKGYEGWLFPEGQAGSNRIFISYSVKDYKLAGSLKTELESVGLSIFLAHEDIEPTEKWRDKIISDLKTCSTFLALRTPNYLGRPYTEQECGFALALNKRILTISIDTNSEDMGFCSEFQGEKFIAGEDEKIFDFCKKQLV